MGHISEPGLLEAIQVNIDVGSDGLKRGVLHLSDLWSDGTRVGCGCIAIQIWLTFDVVGWFASA